MSSVKLTMELDFSDQIKELKQYTIGENVYNCNNLSPDYRSHGLIEEIDASTGEITYITAFKEKKKAPKRDLIKTKLFNPAILLPRKTLKMIEKINKEIIPVEEEHGKKTGRFTEDDLEFQKLYNQSVHPD